MFKNLLLTVSVETAANPQRDSKASMVPRESIQSETSACLVPTAPIVISAGPDCSRLDSLLVLKKAKKQKVRLAPFTAGHAYRYIQPIFHGSPHEQRSLKQVSWAFFALRR